MSKSTAKAKPAKKVSAKPAAKAKPTAKKSLAKAPAKAPAKASAKAPAKAPAKKPSVSKSVSKPAAKKAAVGKKPAHKPVQKALTKKAPAKKVPAKKVAAPKTAVKATGKKPAAAPVKAKVGSKTPQKSISKSSPKATSKPAKPVTKAAAQKAAAPEKVNKKSTAAKAVPPPAAAASVPAPTPSATRKGGRSIPVPQPMPAIPDNQASRFADRFAPAKPSARFQPEPIIEAKPAGKRDPKLANAWKNKAGRDLSEAELLAMPEAQYMNDKQIDFFRARLNALKEDLLSNAGETTEHLREDTTIVPDPADRATIEEEHALELRTRDRERKLLRKISQSLARIDAGEYGYCEETGEPIGLGRLLARPTATLSLEAQQRRELKQRMFGD